MHFIDPVIEDIFTAVIVANTGLDKRQPPSSPLALYKGKSTSIYNYETLTAAIAYNPGRHQVNRLVVNAVSKPMPMLLQSETYQSYPWHELHFYTARTLQYLSKLGITNLHIEPRVKIDVFPFTIVQEGMLLDVPHEAHW